ncbi:hypothetical protein Ngar_c14950 [Candidatus Nitrososphaera gargensis Ga9.2]|uniref:Uncharacterized protein n=1 Tax=Nitrososphaera gargensis (strain Ga9.2) TaxID=1237085 RepID=K0IF64_NITGG|nr:hypothetical protein [Candidatus Nitrososphaera gargensis]AFU58430.1 hypothetical protein Ngar_c14950 [Candidatus Nitrososphaera gargensis Ga9.2]
MYGEFPKILSIAICVLLLVVTAIIGLPRANTNVTVESRPAAIIPSSASLKDPNLELQLVFKVSHGFRIFRGW